MLPTSLAVYCPARLAESAEPPRRRPRRRRGIAPLRETGFAVTSFHYIGAMTDINAEETAEEIEFLRTTPIETVVASHIFRLIQVAAVHLASTPPQLAEARLSIDVVAAIIQAGDERLGEHLDLYRNALAEVQQVYVRAAALPSTTL